MDATEKQERLNEMVGYMRELEWLLPHDKKPEVKLIEDPYGRRGDQVIFVPLTWSSEAEVESMMLVSMASDEPMDWLVHFWGWGMANSNVSFRYTARDQERYATLTWKRSAWPHSVARAISDFVGLYVETGQR